MYSCGLCVCACACTCVDMYVFIIHVDYCIYVCMCLFRYVCTHVDYVQNAVVKSISEVTHSIYREHILFTENPLLSNPFQRWHLWMYVCAYVCVYAQYVHCVYICVREFILFRLCAYVCICVYMCACTYMDTYVLTYIDTCVLT